MKKMWDGELKFLLAFAYAPALGYFDGGWFYFLIVFVVIMFMLKGVRNVATQHRGLFLIALASFLFWLSGIIWKEFFGEELISLVGAGLFFLIWSVSFLLAISRTAEIKTSEQMNLELVKNKKRRQKKHGKL